MFPLSPYVFVLYGLRCELSATMLLFAADVPQKDSSLWNCNLSLVVLVMPFYHSNRKVTNTYGHVQIGLKLSNLGLSFSITKEEQLDLF